MELKLWRKNDFLGTVKLEDLSGDVQDPGALEAISFARTGLLVQGCSHRPGVVSEESLEERIFPGHASFPVLFLEHLQDSGYSPKLWDPEVAKLITKKAENAGLPSSVRQKIAKELPGMSYLEQTFILSKIEETMAQ